MGGSTRDLTNELVNIANALAIAKQAEFMSREHASAVWKQILKNSGFDVPKIVKTNPDAKVNASAN